MLDDIPLGVTLVLAHIKNSGPVDFILANHSFLATAIGFDVNGSGSARIAIENLDGIRSTLTAVAGIQLHDDFGMGVAEEEIPCRFPVETMEIVGMGMIANGHAQRAQLIGQGIEFGRLVQPFLTRLAGHVGTDDKLVADDVIEFKGGLQLGRLEVCVLGMSAAGDQPVLIKHLPDFACRAPPVAGKLHPLISHLRHGSHGSWKVRLAFVADGIQLQADGDFGMLGLAGNAAGQSQRGGAKAGSGEFDKATAV